ncbi:RNA polymerase sigma-70 factor [Actinomadura latina]|uniref:RNA polymerase sigma-70 factor n=1 Tax=Actinomadura latina TaxID=163603 RepID=A0A846YQD1_9ACTN|nr:RNA polymerase sigma-70 factor [Actinomadura latina]NKZ02361.1 RNA polymerase sigma-70 factor [Actinomadura latina]
MDETFEEHRRLLLGLGYRLLGSMWDAEDVVQEAWLRWMRTDRSQIREPRAFLVTVVSRLALDQLRSARVSREAYTGPWLPEPVDGRAFGPLETAELRDTLSYATLHMMERLSPPERAVFVLREAFDLPYDRIAGILGSPAATCRQWHHRAVAHLSRDSERFTAEPSDHAELLTRFLAAARDGDLTALTELLAEDAIAYNDGGGKVRAALRPIIGRDDVLAFVTGLMSRYPLQEAHLTQANGEPAIWTVIGGQRQLAAFDIRAGRIHAIYGVLNPDKLTRIPAAPCRGRRTESVRP